MQGEHLLYTKSCKPQKSFVEYAKIGIFEGEKEDGRMVREEN